MADCRKTVEDRVLGIGASPRRKGNSDLLLEGILAGADDAGVGTAAAQLRDYHFSSCIGCEKCRSDRACTGLRDGMTLLYPEISAAKGIVLVSPTHTYNVTAMMKAFIDRLYCYYDFADTRPRAWKSRLAGQGRKAVIAAVCEQPDGIGFTVEAMRLPLESHDIEVVDEVVAFGLFDRGVVRKRPEILEQARAAGKRLAEALR